MPRRALADQLGIMNTIPDINDTEEWIVATTLKERYGREVAVQYADAEIRLSPADRELSVCPAFVWESDDCRFVIFKTGERLYRCQFFYRGYQQFGTGVHEYDNLTECAVSLLQVQADHMAQGLGEAEAEAGRQTSSRPAGTSKSPEFKR